ncbi:hypothetical protein SAMN05444278_102192 [Psychroflexus salarius]|uniref:Uncharacterized protein n=1 Tax=Psychroflexus salarius TaxID=1155689 RepID=A0A1M4U5M4_9FLAO|nr:hypothetical protein [Psychroflexus salarius]SHE51944.1 hypothetical protein SAMN05444278_102192 [Psychroflexus salarius]
MKTISYKKPLITLIVVFSLYFIGLTIIKHKAEQKLLGIKGLNFVELNISLLGNLSLVNVNYKSPKLKIDAEEVKLNLNYLSTITSSQVEIEYLQLNTASVEVNALNKTTQKSSQSQDKKVSLNQLELKNVNFTINKAQKTGKLTNLNTLVNQVNIYKNFNLEQLSYLRFDHLNYPINHLQKLQLSKFNYKNKAFEIAQLKILPLFSKHDYGKQISHETDLMHLEAFSINSTLAELNFKNTSISNLRLSRLKTDSLNFKISRDKTLKDDKSLKLNYVQQLQNLNFRFMLDSLWVDHATITYAEKHRINKDFAPVVFNDLNLTLTNLNNFKLPKSSNLARLNAQFRLNKASEINLGLSYNLSTSTEDFTAEISGQNILANRFSELLEQSIKTGISGKFNSIKTNIRSRDNSASGIFNLNSSDIEVTLYNNKGRKRQFVSLMANKMIKRSLNTSFQLQNIEKDQTKSLWNFIWSFVNSGLKQALLKF